MDAAKVDPQTARRRPFEPWARTIDPIPLVIAGPGEEQQRHTVRRVLRSAAFGVYFDGRHNHLTAMARTLVLFATALLLLPTRAQRVLPLGTGITGGTGVNDLLQQDDRLVIGGLFSNFNTHARLNLVAWDGDQFYDMPGAFEQGSERVMALELLDGDLIAAGVETNFNNIARWDGAVWNTMGDGSSAQVYALTFFDGELYMGSANGQVDRWDGSAWQQVGDAFSAAVFALEVHEGELYAAGVFDQDVAHTTTLRHLARWTGSAWEEVGGGFNNVVRDLLSTPEGLVAVGDLTGPGDDAFTLPYWAIVVDGVLQQPPMAVPGATNILGVCAHPVSGYLIGGNATTSLWVDGAAVQTLPFGVVRSAALFNDDLLLAGGGYYASYAPVQRIGKLLPGLDLAHLDIGNTSATITPTTDVFNGVNGPGFEVPRGDTTHSIFSASPWVTADVAGTFYSSAPSYGLPEQEGTPTAGPQATLMDEAFYERYYQVWKVDRTGIEHHAAHWNDGGYAVPYMIAAWPGNGDVANGEPAQLAPYADLDHDGVYEPGAGEHPLIRGDQAVLQVLHSVEDIEWPNPGMTLDLIGMHYAYGDAGNTDLYNTVFTNYRIVNRGADDYTNVRFGSFVDLDLGNAIDDYSGCDSLLNLFYVYNADDLDDGLSGVHGYGEQPPAQGALFLNESMSAHRMYTTAAPVPLPDLMNGTENGQPFTELGYPTHYQFPGGAFVDGAGGPGDRRAVGSAGPFALAPGDTLCIDLAFPFARATSGGALASVDELKLRAAALHAWYDAEGIVCNTPDIGMGIAARTNTVAFALYPNPANERVTLTRSRSDATAQVALYDVLGGCVQRVQWMRGASTLPLSVHGLANGTYAVMVVATDGAWTERMIVQR